MQKGSVFFQAVPQSHWQLASTAHKCVLCGKSFGLFQVADNCRGCGRVCCSSCLSDRLVLPGQPGTAPVAVCPICAKAITRTHEEAEMAVQRCQLLEEILNEQALQAEKMRAELREQQEENKLLHHEKERLKATIARMEIEADVAATKAQAAIAAAATTAAPAASPTTAQSPIASPAKSDAEAVPLLDGAAMSEDAVAAMEEQLNKKKRQLDMREATLKDALKKVSADAARNADQRAALQEQEKQLTALVTSKFTALFEEERQRLEDVCTEAVTDVQNQFTTWVSQQQDGTLERKRRYEQLMEERQQRAAAELAEMRVSRDALQRQLESQKDLVESLQEDARRAAEAPTPGQSAIEAANAAWQQEASRLKTALAEATQRAEAAEAQVHRLQAEVTTTKAQYDAEAQTREEAFAAYEAEQHKVQQRMEAIMRDIRTQQAEVESDKAAAIAAARQEAHDTKEREMAALQQQMEAQAQTQVAEAVQRAEQQHRDAVNALEAAHAAEKNELLTTAEALRQQLEEQPTTEKETTSTIAAGEAESSLPAIEELRAEHAEALSQLRAAHDKERAEWEEKLENLQQALQSAEARQAAAVATAAQTHAAAVEELTARHQKEKDAWEKKAKEARRTQSQHEEGLLSQEKSWKEEKAALQKTCKDLEARLETRKTAAWQLQQQLRDCKQQLQELQAEGQKKTEEAEATSAAQARVSTSVQRAAAAFVKEAQQSQQRIAAEHAAAIAQMRSGLQDATRAAAAAASAKEKKAREAVKLLQSQLLALKQEKESAQEQAKAEQEKRAAAETRVEKIKEALHAAQSTAQRHKETLADAQEKYAVVMKEVEALKAEAAAHVEVDSAALHTLEMQAEQLDGFLTMRQRWTQQQEHLEWLYTSALIAVLQREYSTVMDTSVAFLSQEAEKQRQLRARNARALENTTSTIKEVQEDLRVRTQALVERQAALEEEEKAMAEKKRRMQAVCRDLYTVATELRKKRVDGEDSAAVEEIIHSARVMGGDEAVQS